MKHTLLIFGLLWALSVSGQIYIDSYRFGAAGFDPDYQAVLNYATSQGWTLPSAGQQTIQNQLVLDLKAAGAWAKFDILYIFANDAGSDFSRINWKDPNSFLATITGTVTFVTNQGIEGDGSTGWINTNYDPATQGVNLTQNSNSMGYWMTKLDSAPSTAEQHWGNAINTSAGNFWRRYTSSNLYHNNTPAVVGTRVGGYAINEFYHDDRTDNTTVYEIVNGTVATTFSAATSAAIQSVTFRALLYSTTTFSDARIAFGFAGGSLYNERVALNTAFQTYMSSL